MTKEEIMEAIESMTVLELSELVKAMEDKFGVSAAAPVAVAAAPAAGAAAGEEKRNSTLSSLLLATRKSALSKLFVKQLASA